jgi:hypothetical protein
VIGIRALATAGLAVVTMLGLHGCIGVGDSWTREQTAPATWTPPAAALSGAAPAATAGAVVTRVESNVAAVGNPVCGGALPQAITVTAQIADGGMPVTASARYAMTGGAYAGEVTLTRDATMARYTATLPKLEKKHFTATSTNIFVTVTIPAVPSQPGVTSITVTPCGSATH